MTAFFQENPAVGVAFSGGVDSAWLLHEAVRYARRTAAYFVRTPFQPALEQADAADTARRLGATLRVIDVDILAAPGVAANPPDRCYYCKKALFTRLIAAAAADGLPLVADGSNASDDASDRPGMRALRELGVRSPLRECGVTKSEIRRLAAEAALPVWNKPPGFRRGRRSQQGIWAGWPGARPPSRLRGSATSGCGCGAGTACSRSGGSRWRWPRRFCRTCSCGWRGTSGASCWTAAPGRAGRHEDCMDRRFHRSEEHARSIYQHRTPAGRPIAGLPAGVLSCAAPGTYYHCSIAGAAARQFLYKRRSISSAGSQR